MLKFFQNANAKQQEEYIKFLKILGSLSGLFSENSTTPYLYYRAHEKLFCKVFKAFDLSRGDISFDAKKDDLGIGLKTFLQKNGNTFQKVAEFNSENKILRKLNERDLILKIVELRNKRLQNTLNQTATKQMLYHCVTREHSFMNIYEEPMHFINVDKINNIKSKKNTIHFDDEINEYSYSLSKSTLFKRFQTTNVITQIPIEIYENPFEILEQLKFDLNLNLTSIIGDEIYLPLYSPSSGNVEKRSGLNQWNANGRARNYDEVYIPIPKFIHECYPNFFNYVDKNSPGFDVLLPNAKY